MAGTVVQKLVLLLFRLIPLARQSLTYGRPPSFSVLHIDTQMPQESARDESGEEEMSCETVLCL